MVLAAGPSAMFDPLAREAREAFRPGLRRAAGTAGMMAKAGTPFPVALMVEWDAA